MLLQIALKVLSARRAAASCLPKRRSVPQRHTLVPSAGGPTPAPAPSATRSLGRVRDLQSERQTTEREIYQSPGMYIQSSAIRWVLPRYPGRKFWPSSARARCAKTSRHKKTPFLAHNSSFLMPNSSVLAQDSSF